MYHPAGHVVHIARLHGHAPDEALHIAAAFQRGAQGLQRHALLQAVKDARALLRLQDDPCLGLAQLALVLAGVGVVRVDLHAQRIAGRQKLEQQGKRLTRIIARQARPVPLQQKGQRFTCDGAAFQLRDGADLQRFSRTVVGDIPAIDGAQRVAAPGRHVAVAVGRIHAQRQHGARIAQGRFKAHAGHARIFKKGAARLPCHGGGKHLQHGAVLHAGVQAQAVVSQTQRLFLDKGQHP